MLIAIMSYTRESIKNKRSGRSYVFHQKHRNPSWLHASVSLMRWRKNAMKWKYNSKISQTHLRCNAKQQFNQFERKQVSYWTSTEDKTSTSLWWIIFESDEDIKFKKVSSEINKIALKMNNCAIKISINWPTWTFYLTEESDTGITLFRSTFPQNILQRSNLSPDSALPSVAFQLWALCLFFFISQFTGISEWNSNRWGGYFKNYILI